MYAWVKFGGVDYSRIIEAPLYCADGIDYGGLSGWCTWLGPSPFSTAYGHGALGSREIYLTIDSVSTVTFAASMRSSNSVPRMAPLAMGVDTSVSSPLILPKK